MVHLAKKSLGQNFITDPNCKLKLAAKIAGFINQTNPQKIWEIGPGKGDLTQILLNFGLKVLAWELDQNLVAFLQENLVSDLLELQHLDALLVLENWQANKQKLDNFSNQVENAVLIANLPFYIGSRVLVDLGVVLPKIPFLVVLQKEVWQKTRLEDGLTLFGVWLNLFWDLKIEMTLKPSVFTPKPKVDSAVLLGQPRQSDFSKLSWLERQKLFVLVKHLFAHPRKTVWKNLNLSGYNLVQLQNVFGANNWPENLRLDQQNFAKIIWILFVANLAKV